MEPRFAEWVEYYKWDRNAEISCATKWVDLSLKKIPKNYDGEELLEKEYNAYQKGMDDFLLKQKSKMPSHSIPNMTSNFYRNTTPNRLWEFYFYVKFKSCKQE